MATTSSSNIKVTLPKLQEDGSNWVMYKERIQNHLTSKGLLRHLTGTAKRPIEIEEKNGKVHKKGNVTAMTDDEFETYLDSIDTYAQKEAQVREVLYDTLTKTVTLQIKGQPSAAESWKKLTSIFEVKGDMTITDTLLKLANTHYVDGNDMREHITILLEIRERLAEMGHALSDQQFSAYIRTSLTSEYRPLLTSLSAASKATNQTLTSDVLIQAIFDEADNKATEKNVDDARENAAMLAKAGKKGGNSKGDKADKKCGNCKRKGHTDESCFAPGGGKEKEAPEWWKKKFGGEKGKEKETKNASVAEEKESTEENYAFLIDTDNVALVCTSNFHEEALKTGISSPSIIIDCGASSHFTPNRDKLSDYQELATLPIRAADGRTFAAHGRGNMKILLPMGKNRKPTNVTLTNVYYSPHLAFTLVSCTRMTRLGYKVSLKGSECTIYSPTNRVIGIIPETRGLYRFGEMKTPSPLPTANAASQQMSITDFHRRMGHINQDDLRKMVKEGMIKGIDLDLTSTLDFCKTCVAAKATRKSFPKGSTAENIKAYGDKIMADVWGPAEVESIGRKKYYLLFQDRHSHEEYIYFMAKKSEAIENYKRYEAWAKVQRNVPIIKTFGTDRGGEFNSKDFTDHLERQGTIRHLTVHDSPQSNGRVERANRTHLENARAMLIQAKMPSFLWAEAIRHSVWLRNRTYTSSLSELKTPYEIGTGIKPDLTGLLEWGSKVWVKKLNARKLQPQALEAIFVGIDDESKGYRIYWSSHRKVSIERDVYVDKSEVLAPETVQIEGENADECKLANPNSSELKASDENEKKSTEAQTNDQNIPENPSTPTKIPFPHEQNIPDDDQTSPRRGTRARKEAGFYNENRLRKAGEANLATTEDISDTGGAEHTIFTDSFHELLEEALIANPEDEPPVHEALKGPEKEKWLEDMGEELRQITKVETFTIVEAPSNTNIIDGKWVLRRKRDGEGKIIRWKARYVVRGFQQQFGTDFTETFAPTVRPTTLRVLLSIAAQKGATVVQADAKNAYLHGQNDTNEVFHMTVPTEYLRFHSLPSNLSHLPLDKLACRVWRPLYGSRQGAYRFYKFLLENLTDLGLTVSNADEALFYKFSSDGTYLILGAATDDFTIVADSDTTANYFLDEFEKRIELVRLGQITWLLGTTVTRNLTDRTISLGQEAYIDQIATRFGLQNARSVSTPLPPGIDISPGMEHISPKALLTSERKNYREIIGSLMYLSVMTRPDITYAVSVLSQQLENPSITHLEFARRVIKYLKATKNLRLVLGGDTSSFCGYSDADWASNLDRHSISGFVFFLGSGAVSWSSKKQPIVTLSSTESEYVALTHAAKDVIWIQKLLHEISPIGLKHTISPSTVFCDNQSAIRLSKDSTFHARTKHIDVHFHFIHQTVIQDRIQLEYIPTFDMIGDTFTKSLSFHKFSHFRNLLGLR